MSGTEVRTRDEALIAVARGISQWSSVATGALTQASASASAAAATAEAEVRRWATRVSALEGQLSASKDDARGELERQIAAAQSNLQFVQQIRQQVRATEERINTLSRSYARTIATQTSAAQADLAKRGADLGSYRAAGGSGGGGTTGSGTAAGRSSSGAGWLAGSGLTEFDVDDVDYSDNPIIGSFARSKDMSRADYRWAVQTWAEVVEPGLRNGMTRDDFATRDAARGAPPYRRTADVYDIFLGSEPIKLERRANGTFDVTGGRHRIEVARELGVTRLPGKIT